MLSAELRTRVGALDLDVALEVPARTCLALAGPSGAGKTTILRAVAGLLRPDAGRIACGGEPWFDGARRVFVAPELRGCGYLFQDYALFGHLSVWRNVAYGLRGLSRAQRWARAVELLERFGVAALADRRPGSLSGGERQRVALARALAPRPRALLLDEPLSALDARSRGRAGRELGRLLAELEVPALLVTHDFAEAALLGDEVAVLDGGRIVQRGPAPELAARPASGFVADFTGAVVLTGAVVAAADGERPLTVVALDGGGEVRSTDGGEGPVAVSVHPWEVTLEPPEAPSAGSASNRLAAEVVSVTEVGNRVRVGLALPQPLTAEVTGASVERLELAPGRRVVAVWKAAATRVTPR
ncbi:ABC transporter ATP-binding protein [Conexibacter arvalis]|uniref:Molybdate transport system ATP-binding protein n=1 Tax=Conexibacter arvalis TaxID=912552 RepID=A0A840IHE9_9ACTN|nr:ABC transporter ATP-binding protein [Conexibacter arvalis]MBB4663603.1 molybdate transport system ATP-binding protein [Conexibacter arvalis]